MKEFEELLTGGHHNSLGNTIEVVDMVLENPRRFDALFNCYFSFNEVVRLRVSNAMKRICKERKDLLVPYLDRFLIDISNIDQASTQWTLAQLFLSLQKDMSPQQIKAAKTLLTHNLTRHHDWIVLHSTMQTLAHWAATDENLRSWLMPQLERLSTDSRKSVAARAKKLLVKFT